MSRPPPQSYLLRLWREQPGGPMRITVVSVSQPGEHRHFGTLAECCAWLHAQADDPSGSSSDSPGNTAIVVRKQAPEK